MGVSEIIMAAVRLLAGTGVFLVGVHLLTQNIEQLATNKIKTLFERTAQKRLVNVGIGAAATALIQSSGVTTVLIVGFVNVGIIDLYQATAMIMGANIGTTITAQIAALSAFPITTYVQVLSFVGIMMGLSCKRDGLRRAGMIMAGLGLIFTGLSLMSGAMSSGKDAIQAVFQQIQNPFLLFFIGILLTALVQSSSATTSVVIAMSVAGLTIGTGGNEVLFLILGTNIGSCVTALMSSMTAGGNARRAGLIHLLFNSFGSLIFLALLLCWPGFMAATFQRWFPSVATQIAMFHTFFNLVCTGLFLPFCGLFVKASKLLIRDQKPAAPTTYLDERMLSSPALAISQLEKELVLLADGAMQAFCDAFRSFQSRDEALIAPVRERIEQANATAQSIIDYLIRLSSQSKLSEEESISRLYNHVGDIMRIAEIADNFTKYTRRSIDQSLRFSPQGLSDILAIFEKVKELYSYTREYLLSKDPALLPLCNQAEETIDALRRSSVDSHIKRLKLSECDPKSSGVFINMVSNLERLGDHLTYILGLENGLAPSALPMDVNLDD